MTLGQVLAELRAHGLVLTSAEIAHEQVSRFTVIPAGAPAGPTETKDAEEAPQADPLDRFLSRKGKP